VTELSSIHEKLLIPDTSERKTEQSARPQPHDTLESHMAESLGDWHIPGIAGPLPSSSNINQRLPKRRLETCCATLGKKATRL